MNRLVLALILCLTPATVVAQTDSVRIIAVIEQFHAALAGGDSAGAMALVAPDAVILEGGWSRPERTTPPGTCQPTWRSLPG